MTPTLRLCQPLAAAQGTRLVWLVRRSRRFLATVPRDWGYELYDPPVYGTVAEAWRALQQPEGR